MAGTDQRELPVNSLEDQSLTPTQEFAYLSELLQQRVRAADIAEKQRVKTHSTRWLRLAVRLVIDVLLLTTAFGVAYWARYEAELIRNVAPEFHQPLEAFGPLLLLFLSIAMITFYSRGVYAQPRGTSWFDQVTRIGSCMLIAICLFLLSFLLFSPTLPSRLFFVFLWLAAIGVFGVERYAVRRVRMMLWKRGINEYRVIVVGATTAGQRVMRQIATRPDMGYRLVGFVDDREVQRRWFVPFRPDHRPERLGGIVDLYNFVSRGQVDELIIALGGTRRHDLPHLLAHCDKYQVRYRVVPDLMQVRFDHTEIETLDGLPLIGLKEPALRGWRLIMKRIVDVVLSSLLLILVSPLILAIAVLIRLEKPRGPIFFQQTRAGRGGKVFQCIKFRSMRPDAEQLKAQLLAQNEADGPIFKMKNDPRVTRVGKWLRKTSLDELPQLFNILRGDMSFVGPRPPIPREVVQYSPWHLQRLEVKPGLTGLWQVSGRSNLTFDEMVTLDLYYAENWSLMLDFKLMLQTIPAVLFARGAY